MNLRLIMLSVVPLMFVLPTQAQDQTHVHAKPAITRIDGSKNPELIADSKAARLFIIDLSIPANASDKLVRSQASRLSNLNLSAQDIQYLRANLEIFRSQFDYLVSEYNRKATNADARGAPADTAFFNQQVDDLIATTQKNIVNRISLQGGTEFGKRIQEYKRHINLISSPLSVAKTKATGFKAVNFQVCDQVASNGLGRCPPPPPSCTPTFAIDYATSYTETIDQVGINTTTNPFNVNLHASGTVSGTGAMTFPAGCPTITTTHTPTTVTTLGTTETTVAGTPLCPSCFITATAESTTNNIDTSLGTFEGAEFSYNVQCDIQFNEIFLIQLEFEGEIAYERTASLGSQTGCKRNTDGTTSCFVQQRAWCTAATTPPDLQVTEIFTETFPTSPFSYYENLGPCLRPNPQSPWICLPDVLSLPYLFGSAPLASCTFNPQQPD